MEQSVRMEIPRQWLAGVPDEPMALQQIFRQFIDESAAEDRE